MALLKLEISDGSLLLDDAQAGLLTTSPPDGVTASTVTSTEGGVVSLSIRWLVERIPDQLIPLEVLRVSLGEFFPWAAFVGGRKYDLSRTEPFSARRLGFPYNTYYKFKIRAPGRYDPAVFSKMPIACWQEQSRAFAIVFPKRLELPQGSTPLFIRTSGAEAAVDFSAAILNEFEVERKPFGWFGTGSQRIRYEMTLSPGRLIEATFLMVAADTWVECVETCERYLHGFEQAVQLPDDALNGMLERALPYYDRIWDGHNRTHVHLPVKNVPRFESVEVKHSHITDDFTKLVLYRRLGERGYPHFKSREQALLNSLIQNSYTYDREGARLWHTTTYYNGHDLEAFTHHGAGYVGFPGGMATIIRRLFEYCSLEADPGLIEIAEGTADWLVKTQGEDGSWPTLIPDKSKGVRTGCVASSAEAVRALLAAYRLTRSPRYHAASESGLRFVNREESFFECRQYLRDIDEDDADGITAEACIHANLDWYSHTHDGKSLESARKWGFYALQWIRPPSVEYGSRLSFDGLARSITPRIDVWGGLLIARALLRLGGICGEKRWRDCAWLLFANIGGLQERDGGFCETWFLDFPSRIESIHIEPTFVTDAFVEFILDAFQFEGRTANERSADSQTNGPSFEASETSEKFIELSSKRPEWIFDDEIRLRLAFEGVYNSRSAIVQAVYTMLREVRVGRFLLKAVPAAKILLDRHRVSPPRADIGKSAGIEVLSFAKEESDNGYWTHRFHTPFHDIILSVATGFSGGDRSPAADLHLGVKTLAGDVRVGQVRIDVLGHYDIVSVHGAEKFVVSYGDYQYEVQVVEGMVGEIIREGRRLALDISLNSNWSFFGEYDLRLRVSRSSRPTK